MYSESNYAPYGNFLLLDERNARNKAMRLNMTSDPIYSIRPVGNIDLSVSQFSATVALVRV